MAKVAPDGTLVPKYCCTKSKEGEVVARNECCSGGKLAASTRKGQGAAAMRGPQPIILAREVVGKYEDYTGSVTMTLHMAGCGDNCIMGCCRFYSVPCLCTCFVRDCTDCRGTTGGCKKTNTFYGNLHWLSFTDKDTYYDQYMCCPADEFTRLGT